MTKLFVLLSTVLPFTARGETLEGGQTQPRKIEAGVRTKTLFGSGPAAFFAARPIGRLPSLPSGPRVQRAGREFNSHLLVKQHAYAVVNEITGYNVEGAVAIYIAKDYRSGRGAAA